MRYTIVEDESALEAALRLAGGSYQEGLLLGQYRLSGADLAGRAREYAARYAESRRALLGRIREAGIPMCERRGPRGERILVIGAWE